jgi:hypothetical protein
MKNCFIYRVVFVDANNLQQYRAFISGSPAWQTLAKDKIKSFFLGGNRTKWMPVTSEEVPEFIKELYEKVKTL